MVVQEPGIKLLLVKTTPFRHLANNVLIFRAVAEEDIVFEFCRRHAAAALFAVLRIQFRGSRYQPRSGDST